MIKLDDDLAEALVKMEKTREILSLLPNADCSACGAPSCQALAQDIVLEGKSVRQCIFIQRKREASGEMIMQESYEIMKQIWGDEKFKIN
jgi:Na+-translocating ferredoxin:NAD+ oxidoreductase RNF subunit RnfB